MLDDIKKILWVTPDKLRANMDAAVEYKHLALGLIFVKGISGSGPAAMVGNYSHRYLRRSPSSLADHRSVAELKTNLAMVD